MVRRPKISVLMAVFNAEKYLRQAMESILTQTCIDFEFIIVDDASTDNSSKIINSYDDKRIRVINNQANIGLTKSLNIGIKHAQGDYIARQDADDISLPNRLKAQLRHFQHYPETALLGTSAYGIDADGKIQGEIIVMADPRTRLSERNRFCHGSTMFKTQIVRELGGYNELFKYCQDYELWLRIAQYHNVRNLTEILYKQRFHPESVQFKKRHEAVLYRYLAVRLARNDLDAEALKLIKVKGIECLYPHLNNREKLFVNKVAAYMHMKNNNPHLARQEYRKVMRLNPLDLKNYVALILSYLGKSAWTVAHAHRDSKGFRRF